MRSANSLLFGATTFRGMRSYWPRQLDNPDATDDDHAFMGVPATDLHLLVARRLDGSEIVLLTYALR